MGIFLSKRELEQVEPAENAFDSPVPTTMISNGEFNPLPQSENQKRLKHESRNSLITMAQDKG